MTTGRDIMERAGILLNDEDHVRWTPSELGDWINEAVRAIVLAKPSASSSTVVFELQAGTLQHLPEDDGNLSLLALVRNITGAGTEPRTGGRAIRPVDRVLLDTSEPDWHDSTVVPHQTQVRQYVFDEETPLDFYVYPGNDGTGQVEAQVSRLPDALAADPSDAPDDVASWETDIGLDALYDGPLLEFVLYRCEGKDDLGATPGRAAVHYQAFAAAVGLKIQVEKANSPNARRATA